MFYQSKINCVCGKIHCAGIDECVVGEGAINRLPQIIKQFNGKNVFLLSDITTQKVAGIKVKRLLTANGIEYKEYIIDCCAPEPNENTVGSVLFHFDSSCDVFVGIGSGVINDLSKIVSNTAKIPYIIVATAPSMDGYASATSSMVADGLKVSITSKCPNAIIGDTDILKTAPDRMLISGLGDMLAKYISLAEWKIANLITGEYYCDNVADIMRNALNKCVANAKGLLLRYNCAVEAVFEGLVVGGIAMSYAGCSRPASGVEHYFSHVWDMRGLQFKTAVDFHGIQCAIGTVYAAKIYEKLKEYKPDRDKALKYVNSFNYDEYAKSLQDFLGQGGKLMIANEKSEKKYDKEKHARRLDRIIDNWSEIVKAMEAIPSAKEIETILDDIHAPKTAAEIGIDEKTLRHTFAATKDIRDKYVLSRLCWDLGIIDEIF